MLFNSVDYLCFFPIVVLLYFAFPKKVRNIWLLFASYYFYMSWNMKYGLLIFFVTALTYLGGLFVGKFRKFRGGVKYVWQYLL